MTTKKRSEKLADALVELLRESSDIDGAAVVGVDGLVYSANVPQKALDEEMVGATSAAILGLSKRSVGQLKRGDFKQALIQGDDGNIIVTSLNDETLLIGLTPHNVNLGMAFAETRNMIQTLSSIL
ncbi:MAG: roadblock/LC7 domain-containing protein [Anaerolineae bacterium]|nr:roadblock/LC7 domain-containing protein [Anaerolineae bacterium]